MPTGSLDTLLALLHPRWRQVLAAFPGWFPDAFDQVALLLVLPQTGQGSGVSLTAMEPVITAQSVGAPVIEQRCWAAWW